MATMNKTQKHHILLSLLSVHSLCANRCKPYCSANSMLQKSIERITPIHRQKLVRALLFTSNNPLFKIRIISIFHIVCWRVDFWILLTGHAQLRKFLSKYIEGCDVHKQFGMIFLPYEPPKLNKPWVKFEKKQHIYSYLIHIFRKTFLLSHNKMISTRELISVQISESNEKGRKKWKENVFLVGRWSYA